MIEIKILNAYERLETIKGNNRMNIDRNQYPLDVGRVTLTKLKTLYVNPPTKKGDLKIIS